MIDTDQTEEEYSEIQNNTKNSGFIATIAYLASLVMPFICYIWLTFFR